jgi:hypothetical protein
MTPGVLAGAGLDYLKGRAQSLFNAFPDVHFEIEDIVQLMTDSLHESPCKVLNAANLQGSRLRESA